jgi:hypothetical protein
MWLPNKYQGKLYEIYHKYIANKPSIWSDDIQKKVIQQEKKPVHVG